MEGNKNTSLRIEHMGEDFKEEQPVDPMELFPAFLRGDLRPSFDVPEKDKVFDALLESYRQAEEGDKPGIQSEIMTLILENNA